MSNLYAGLLSYGSAGGPNPLNPSQPAHLPYRWNEIISGCVVNVDKKDATGIATLNCIPAVFSLVLNFIFIFSAIVAVFLIVFSGIKFLTSGGDAKQVESARHTLTYALIGFILILASFAIINFISDVTGVGCIKSFGLLGTCK